MNRNISQLTRKMKWDHLWKHRHISHAQKTSMCQLLHRVELASMFWFLPLLQTEWREINRKSYGDWEYIKNSKLCITLWARNLKKHTFWFFFRISLCICICICIPAGSYAVEQFLFNLLLCYPFSVRKYSTELVIKPFFSSQGSGIIVETGEERVQEPEVMSGWLQGTVILW